MSITKDLQVFSFFQIEIETTIGDSVKDMFTKDELKKIDLNKKIKVRNNDSIITPKNWSEYKDIFFNQRMSKYKASYTENEKIKLELEDLNKLTISSPDYKILKKRYKKYLKALLNIELPQQTESNKSDNYKNYIWFKIGLMFANGEMQNLLIKFNNNATQIAKHLGNKEGFRPFISESIGVNYKTSLKSIFSSKDKMNKIIEHCKENKIEVINEFTRRLPIE